MRTECSIDGCERLSVARTWCPIHYERWRKYGDTSVRKSRHLPLVDRFWVNVQKGPGCWLWTGRVHEEYGSISGALPGEAKSRSRQAHRLSYELVVGPIPEGLLLDHRCRNTLCVNPTHLRPVTRKQNGEHRGGAPINSSTGVLGVTVHVGAYVVRVGHDGRIINGGRFKTLEEAAEAARQLRLSLFTHNDMDRRTA